MENYKSEKQILGELKEEIKSLTKQRDELIYQLEKWIDGCEVQTEHFSELGMTASELSSQAMGQAYRNVLTLLTKTKHNE